MGSVETGGRRESERERERDMGKRERENERERQFGIPHLGLLCTQAPA